MPQETTPNDSHPDAPLLTQRELAPFIRAQTGIPLTQSTITKLCSPAIGDGPPAATWYGRRPLYARDAVLAWAKTRLSPERRSTPHDPEKWPAFKPATERTKRAGKHSRKAAR